MANDYARYARQIIFSGIGHEGQEKLLNARVVLVGCGATVVTHREDAGNRTQQAEACLPSPTPGRPILTSVLASWWGPTTKAASSIAWCRAPI